MQDLRYALRQFQKNPGFLLATVLILALGIGANTAIFSVVNRILLRPLPYKNGSHLVHIGYQRGTPGKDAMKFSIPDLVDLREQDHAFAGISEYHSMPFTVIGRGEPDRLRSGVVSAGFFDDFGVEALVGRTFQPADDQPGAPPVLIMAYSYWQSRFGRDPSIVGQTLKLNGQLVTVVGVLPPLPQYPGKDDIYIPISVSPFRSNGMVLHDRSFKALNLYGRLKKGVTLPEAQASINTVAARLHHDYPESYPRGETSIPLGTIQEELTGQFRSRLLILLGTVGLVLLIACANVANLTLARLISREREVNVRVALGAGRGRLVRQLLTETTLIALLGGALGLFLAYSGVGLLVAFASRFTPLGDEVPIDPVVLLFTLVVSLMTGLAFGLIPALQVSKRGNLALALKEGSGRSTIGVGGHRFRSAMIVAQVTVSFALLIAAGLTLRSLIKLERVDAGFNAENVLTVTVELPFSKYSEQARILTFFDTLLQRIEQHPGVVSASLGTDFPLAGEQMVPTVRIEGRVPVPGAPEPRGDSHLASPDYFRTLGIPLLAGRVFTDHDDRNGPLVAVVNQSMARLYWPGTSPVGKHFATSMGDAGWRTVVGVVGDVKQNGLTSDSGPAFYFPFRQEPLLGMEVLVRAKSDPAPLVGDIRRIVREIDPDQPIASPRTLAEVRSHSVAPFRFTAVLFGLFAGLAFLITAMGISGVVAFSVSERTQEIGIRSALGAGRLAVLALVLRESMVLVAVGIGIGVFGSLILSRLLSSLLFGIEPTDPLTFVLVSLLLIIVVGAASLVPAQKATSIDPIIALRA